MKKRAEPSDDDPMANEGDIPRGDAVLTEQRRNLNRQVTTLRQIDQTAERAVRIAAIIIGFITTAATAVSQTSQSPAGSALFLVGVGVVLLLATMTLGVLTTGETGYKTRLTDGEYMRLSKPYPPEGCERVALRKYYRNWSQTTADILGENSKRLAGVQRSLTLGVVFVAASGFAQLYGQSLGNHLWAWFGSTTTATVASLVSSVLSVLCSLLIVGVATLLTIRIVL